MLTRLYNQEFTESGSPKGKSENRMSVEDAKFIKILEDEAKIRVRITASHPLQKNYMRSILHLYFRSFKYNRSML